MHSLLHYNVVLNCRADDLARLDLAQLVVLDHLPREFLQHVLG